VSGAGPYVGLRDYRAADADLFFGRDAEIRDVRSLWLSSRLLVLFGRSGVGKSSLLQAGVLRGLANANAEVLPIGRIAAPHGVGGVRENPFTAALAATWGLGTDGRTITERLRWRAGGIGDYGEAKPFLVAIDQFEDLFNDALGSPEDREQFIVDLAAALRDIRDLNLLITVRDDFLAAVLPLEDRLITTARRRYRLLALEPVAAEQAVSGPLAGTGRTFGPGAAAHLVEALRTTHATDALGRSQTRLDRLVEPVQLQLVCERMWTALPRELTEITIADVTQYGNVDRTLSDFYEDAVSKVSQRFHVRQDDMRVWIENAFISETGTRDMAYEGASTTAGMPNEIPAALADEFILRAEMRGGSRWYELAHDRLIAPILRSNRAFAELTAPAGQPAWAVVRRLQAAESALVSGRLDDAEGWAREVYHEVQDTRMRAEADVLLGRIAARRSGVEHAEARYRQAAEAFEGLGDQAAVGRVYARLGDAYLESRQYHPAITSYRRALERIHGDLEVQLAFATTLWHTGQRRAALGVLGQILTVDPSYAPALDGRGQLLAELGDGEAALLDLDRAIKLNTDPRQRPALHSALALALASLGRTDEAADQLRMAHGLRAVAGMSDAVLDLRTAQVAAAGSDAARAAELAAAALRAQPPLAPVHAADARRLLTELGRSPEPSS
jgi:tetratricopeptide (TPR) repeat protein